MTSRVEMPAGTKRKVFSPLWLAVPGVVLLLIFFVFPVGRVLILSIQDPQTKAVLWTTSANVRALGAQDRRDRGFDQSVAVLVDKLGQLTGQPLTSAQLKAVKSNSKWPTAAKVILVVGIAAGVAILTYGIYRVTHPPTLSPPTLPTLPALSPVR